MDPDIRCCPMDSRLAKHQPTYQMILKAALIYLELLHFHFILVHMYSRCSFVQLAGLLIVGPLIRGVFCGSFLCLLTQ